MLFVRVLLGALALTVVASAGCEREVTPRLATSGIDREAVQIDVKPLGKLTEQEIVLGRALRNLKGKIESASGALEAVAEAVVDGAIHEDVLPYLERMGLAEPQSLKETVFQRLLAAELRQQGVGH